MNKIKSTKRALIISAVAVLMSISMLIGTTYAWFTDTAATAVNKIQSGKLNVALEMSSDGVNWENAEGQTLTFKTKDNRAADKIFWEPGCTYELPQLRVVNKGTLALKYKIQITGIQGDAKLNEVIDWTVNDAAIDLTEGHLTAGQEGTPFTIKGHMLDTAGNDYQNLTIDGIGITVVAAQYTYEYDSEDNRYDEDAAFPVVAKNQSEVNDAITNAADKKATIAIPANKTVTLDNGIANEGAKSRDITFIGDGSQTVDVITNAVGAEGGQLNYQRGSSFIFENLTIKAGEGNFDGIVCNELVYKNCTIKGKLTLYGKATFINCTFENDMENQYSVWTWGGTDVLFDGCTFNTNGKAILLYGQATAAKPTNLTVNGCTFNDRSNGAAGKAAIEIGNDYKATYNLVVNDAAVNGFAAGKNTGSNLWANKNSMDTAHLNVVIDGKDVH